MSGKIQNWYLPVALLLMISLLLPVLNACGGDDDGDETASATSQTTTTSSTQSPTATTSGDPVYIGAISSWSGAAAMSGVLADQVIEVVEYQVKEMGGILGGRELKVIREDNESSVAHAVAAAEKLASDDKVACLVFGGASPAEVIGVGEVTEELQILYVAISAAPWLEPLKFSVGGSIHEHDVVQPRIDITSKLLKAKTVGFLAADDANNRQMVTWMHDGLEELGTETVYEGYVPQGTMDMSPYLTKVKYENPDVLILESNTPDFHILVAKNIMDLGGWGDIKVVTLPSGELARKMPGAEGWYVLVAWLPEMQNPGSIKFVNDFRSVNRSDPLPAHVYFYITLWTAIEAIELAGTDSDRVAIAEAARSGNLEWETPLGLARWEPDGYARFHMKFAHVEEGGELNIIEIPE